MRRLAFLFAVLLATTTLAPGPLAPLAPVQPAEAQAAPVPLALFLSSATGNVGNLQGVETLTTAPPTKADDSRRVLFSGGGPFTGASGAWYQTSPLPGIAGEATVDGAVTGTTWFAVTGTPLGGLLGVVGTVDLEFQLRKVLANGTDAFLSNTTAQIGPIVSPLTNETSVAWSIPAPNQSLLAGESLSLNISASGAGIADLSVLYDSTAHPSGFNITLLPVARGDLQLSATTTSREAAPGASPTYIVSVRNRADQADTVTIAATGAPAEYAIRLTSTSLPLAAGQSGNTLVTVVIPANAADGTRHTTTVTATSANGGAPQTLTLTTTVRATSTAPTDNDGDGYTNAEETRYSSDPNDANSTPDTDDDDNDGVSNRAEVDAGTDPFDANDFPGSGGANNQPGGNGAGACSIFPLCDVVATSTGVDAVTADILSIILILLFLLIIALLLWWLLGGYPVSVVLVEPRATTEPGRGADFAVEVKSRLGRAQQVDLEAAGLPGDWDVRFNKPQVTLDAKQSEVVGMLVRPPGGWPAPSKRDFEVRARSRLKPEKFAKAVAKLSINPRSEAAVAPPAEEAVAESAEAWRSEPEPEAVPVPYVVPVPAGGAGAAAFKVGIHDVRHNPAVPERGAEVTTIARVDNNGPAKERLRVVLVVNGKVRDEVQVELGPGEGAEAEFHWVAYLARNEVKVVAERA